MTARHTCTGWYLTRLSRLARSVYIVYDCPPLHQFTRGCLLRRLLRRRRLFLVVFRFAFRFVPFRDPVFVRFILSVARSSSHVSGSSSGFPPRASIRVSHVARHREGSNPCSPRYSSSCTRLHVWRFKRYPSTAAQRLALLYDLHGARGVGIAMIRLNRVMSDWAYSVTASAGAHRPARRLPIQTLQRLW